MSRFMLICSWFYVLICDWKIQVLSICIFEMFSLIKILLRSTDSDKLSAVCFSFSFFVCVFSCFVSFNSELYKYVCMSPQSENSFSVHLCDYSLAAFIPTRTHSYVKWNAEHSPSYLTYISVSERLVLQCVSRCFHVHFVYQFRLNIFFSLDNWFFLLTFKSQSLTYFLSRATTLFFLDFIIRAQIWTFASELAIDHNTLRVSFHYRPPGVGYKKKWVGYEIVTPWSTPVSS